MGTKFNYELCLAFVLSSMKVEKKCSRCKKDKVCSEDKELSEFHRRANGKWYSYCKECHREYTAAHYEANKEKYLAKARRYDKGHREKAYAWLFQYFREHPCIDCGETNPIVLEFDHRDGEKKECAVSSLLNGYRRLTVEQEIAKCDVRCANCHRKRTAIQRNWYWLEFLKKFNTPSSATG